MITQLERVIDFIKEMESVYTWELERWALENAYRPSMLGSSAVRCLMKLKLEGRVEHPIIDGKRNVHLYKWIEKPVFNKQGQGELFKGG